MAAEHGAPQFGNRNIPPGNPEQRGNMFTPQLTPEEIQAIKECNHESFVYRCLPYSAILMAATHVAVMKGFLKPHPRFGPLFKNMGAGFAGYILGKMSYQGACRDKILKLQNSPLAEAMRRRQQGLPPLVQSQAGTDGQEMPSNYVSQRRMSEYQPDYDLDTSRHQSHHPVEDTNRPSVDDPVAMQSLLQDPKAQKYINYDDLRRQNRDAYDRKMSNIASQSDYQRRQQPVAQQQQLPPQSPGFDNQSVSMPSSSMYAPDYSPHRELAPQRDEVPQPATRGLRQRRNKYGDLITDE